MTENMRVRPTNSLVEKITEFADNMRKAAEVAAMSQPENLILHRSVPSNSEDRYYLTISCWSKMRGRRGHWDNPRSLRCTGASMKSSHISRASRTLPSSNKKKITTRPRTNCHRRRAKQADLN